MVSIDQATNSANPDIGSFVSADLVTEGYYKAAVDKTVENTKRLLARRVAQEGCDLLVVDGEEWIRFVGGGSRRTDYQYLRAQWGTENKDMTGTLHAAP
mgnify:CR=1 FL=1